MENKQITKHQHFIPNFLIKRWKDEKNNIIIVDDQGQKNKINFKDNKKFFSKKFLYESPKLFYINSLENKIQKIEELYAKLTAKIINNVEKDILFKDSEIYCNDIALIELFVKLQMFRNFDYWQIFYQKHEERLLYLNDLIDNYYKYTQMSDAEKENITKEIINLRERIIKSKNKNFDNIEYQLHKIYNSPKYFLIHSIHLSYYYTAMKFKNEYLPIANLGQFIFLKENDNNYFYIIPLSPKIAIIKRLFVIDHKKNFIFLMESFYKEENKINFKKIMFNELRTVSKYSVASPKWNNEDFIKDFNLYLKENISLRINNNENEANLTKINK